MENSLWWLIPLVFFLGGLFGGFLVFLQADAEINRLNSIIRNKDLAFKLANRKKEE